MTKRISILLLAVTLIVAGCSSRRTRQFIAETPPSDGLQAGAWEIELPSVIAFKDVIDLDKIADTTMFWVSIKARKPRAGGDEDLSIDSVKISFLPGNESHWRYATRMAPFNQDGGYYTWKSFEFFGDQGIVIPPSVDRIMLQFEAVTSDDRQTFSFEMVRDESKAVVPLLRE